MGNCCESRDKRHDVFNPEFKSTNFTSKLNEDDKKRVIKHFEDNG
jgi:hypothetical protein